MINNATQTSSQSMSRTKRISSKEAIQIFTRRIRGNLEFYYDDIDKNNVDIIGSPLGGQFANTFCFDIFSGNIRHRIYAKICPVYESLDPAKIEYETLKALYDVIHDIEPDLSVSRPLDYLPEFNAYFQESVGTSNLRTFLLQKNSRFIGRSTVSEILDKVSGSARWLSVFHGITMKGHNIDFDFESYIGSFEEEFDYRELRELGFKKGVIDNLEGVIGRLSSLTGRLTMPCAKWHWDYTPGHVYIDNGKVSVIDILGVDDTPIYEDIGHFLAALTSTNNLPFHPFFDHKRACFDLCDQFIEKYYLGTNYDETEFMLLTNIYRLKYLLVYFLGQYRLVCDKTHPVIGKLFAKYRMVYLFKRPLEHTLEAITELMKNYLNSGSVNKTTSQ